MHRARLVRALSADLTLSDADGLNTPQARIVPALQRFRLLSDPEVHADVTARSGVARPQAPDRTGTSFFTAPERAAPGARFAGRLTFATTEMHLAATPVEHFVRFPWARAGVFDFLAAADPAGAAPLMQLDKTLFPGLTLDLVITDGGDVIPLERGVIRNPVATRTASFWEIIAGPGRAWATGDGWSRASLPISLVQSYEGEAWLGLACFDYRGREVTPLRFQGSSVSGGGFLFWDADCDVSAWAEVPFSVVSIAADAQAGAATFVAERAFLSRSAPPPGLGEGFARARSLLDPKGPLALAVLMDDTLYPDLAATLFWPCPVAW
jgi:hypothetical protein